MKQYFSKQFYITLLFVFALAGIGYSYLVQLGKIDRFAPKWKVEKVQEIYNKLAKASGQQFGLPLTVEINSTINAYATPNGIVIFTGILNQLETEDEVAMILGHEIAHVMNWDVYTRGQPDNDIIRVMEARADKLGAFLMMRAGYDICEGRNAFKVMNDVFGDNVIGTHPSFAYRFSQLNIKCGGDL